MRFCEVFIFDHGGRLGAVAGPDGRLRGIQVDQVFLDEARLLGLQSHGSLVAQTYYVYRKIVL